MMQRPDTKWVIELLTNVRISVYKTNFLLGNPRNAVPEHIKLHKAIYSLVADKRTGKLFNDNFCAFRCLALHKGYSQKNLKAPCTKYYKRWERVQEPQLPFQGIRLEEDMSSFEKLFETNVEVFTLDENGIAKNEYSSLAKFPSTMYLNLSGTHLSYIHNFELYSKKYQCRHCSKLWQSSSSCMRHSSTCESKNKFVYPGGFNSIPQYIFDHLMEAGIECKNDHYPWFIVYDFESIQPQIESTGDSKTEYLREHIPVSVSVCSNVLDFTEPRCFINRDPDQLVQDMLQYMTEISYAAHELAEERWSEQLDSLRYEAGVINAEQGERTNLNQTSKKKDEAGKKDKDQLRKDEMFSLLCKFENYMSQIPVLGFCSSRYDINLVKQKLLLHLDLHQSEESCNYVIKKCNSYVCISSQNFKFLDMAQYLAPNSCYADFLKAFNVKEQKGFFPYEWFDDYSKLDYPRLPRREDFYNVLKDEELSQTDYDKCLRTWSDLGMTTFEDFLIWYNNRDAGPLVTAVERWQEQYFNEGLDVFKTAISLPGLARQKLYKYAFENNAQFSLIDKTNADLHQVMTQNLFGGPSIVFHRHMKSGVTKIRDGKLAEKVHGFDSNALYVWCLDQPLPTGIFVKRKAETGFEPLIRDIYIKAFAWLDYLNESCGGSIQHLRNMGYEKRVGPYPVDGYKREDGSIYQFHGCYIHGHLCELTKNIKNDAWHEGRQKRLERTQSTTQYIESEGFHVVEMWECEFNRLCRRNPSLYRKLDIQRPDFFRKHGFKKKVTEKQILDGVLPGNLFGFVQCDLSVPDRWGKGFENFSDLTPYEYFKEMSPIFCTSEVPFESYGEHMQRYVEEMGMGKTPRVLLVGGMSAQEILIATPLLRWYLQQGIVVTKIHQVVECQQKRCFKGLARDVTAVRRAGDTNPDLKIMAETKKTQGNSSYGALCMDKSKHTNVNYYKGHVNASQAVNEPQFRKLTCLDEDRQFYEVHSAKDKITMDVPIQLAVFILNLAKLRLLAFAYDEIDRLVDRSDYMLLETDTDSLYMALSKPTLDEVVKPHLKDEYLKTVKGQCKDGSTPSLEYLPRSCCSKHALFDKREPGVFKTEFIGDEMIGLCSKTYFVENRELHISKLSCKGANKKRVRNPKEKFEKVLQQKRPQMCENFGIKSKGNTMFTYRQAKIGFNYFYVKRKVLHDGVSTDPLDLVLKPAKRSKRAQEVQTEF